MCKGLCACNPRNHHVVIISWVHDSTRITGRIQTSAWPTSHPQLSFAARLQRMVRSNYSVSHCTQPTKGSKRRPASGQAPASCPLRSAVLRLPWFKNRAKTGAIIVRSSLQVTLAREPCEPKEDLAVVKKKIGSQRRQTSSVKSQRPSWNPCLSITCKSPTPVIKSALKFWISQQKITRKIFSRQKTFDPLCARTSRLSFKIQHPSWNPCKSWISQQ